MSDFQIIACAVLGGVMLILILGNAIVSLKRVKKRKSFKIEWEEMEAFGKIGDQVLFMGKPAWIIFMEIDGIPEITIGMFDKNDKWYNKTIYPINYWMLKKVDKK